MASTEEPFNVEDVSEPQVSKGLSKKTIIVIVLGIVIVAAIIAGIVILCLSSGPSEKQGNLKDYCYNIPKAELHIHIEGSFEPELAFAIAERNGIKLPYESVEELKKKYKFNNLQEFLDLYYKLCDVLINEEDFADLAYAYAKKAHSQGTKYAEIFFDPQSHLSRNVTFETLITGLTSGLDKAKKELKDFDYNLIMCFLRHLSEEEAFDTYNEALPYRKYFFGIGLDSSEVGYPPENFKNIYAKAKEDGFHLVAHAGEEGPAEYVKQALDLLHVERIDHGNHIIDDSDLTQRVANEKIPLTMCPLSNQKLQVCPDLKKHEIKKFLNDGLQVMVNSDDPSYFGGYIGDNYYALVEYLDFTKDKLKQIAINSFNSTFLDDEQKNKYIKLVKEFSDE